VQSNKKIIFDVNVALTNLEFHVHVTSEYICRQCHGVLKKRSNLQQNLGKPTEIHENKLRHMFAGSWACFSAQKFAGRCEFEFEEASTRTLMSWIERKYCLISTSCLEGLSDIFILLHI